MSLLINRAAHLVGIVFSLLILGGWLFLFHKIFYGSLEFRSTALFIIGYIALIGGIVENDAELIAGVTLLLLISGTMASFFYDSYIKLPLVLLCGYIVSILIGTAYRVF